MDDLSFGLAVRWGDSVKPKATKTMSNGARATSTTKETASRGTEKGKGDGKNEYAASRPDGPRKAK
jgi:hypothetical protein